MLDTGEFPNITKVWLTAGISQTPGGSYIKLFVWHWSQTGWKFLSSASDITATPLPLQPVDRSLGLSAGTVQEKVAIDVSEAYLQARAASGLNIHVAGQKGSLIVEVPAAYVQGFLERYRKEHALALGGPAPLADIGDRATTAAPTAEATSSTTTGPTPKAQLGVQLMDMPALGSMMKAYGVQGVTVTFVQPDLPAAKAGLVPGDMINRRGIPTARGGCWHASSVRNVVLRCQN